MKKTAEEILRKHYDIMTNGDTEGWTEFEEDTQSTMCMIRAMKEYALEAIKADRERVAVNTKIAFHCGTTKITHSISHYQSGADNIQIDKQSILNLPIELL